MSGKLTDKFLIANALSGDEEAFGKLYDSYVDEIYRFACMRIRSRVDAEDLTSETFLKAWQYLSAGDKQIDNFRALLYRIARNLVIDQYRKHGREMLAIDNEQLTRVIDEHTNIEQTAIQKDDIQFVMAAVNQLPEEQRELILMRFVQDLSTKEIAAITEKKTGAVRVSIHRAVKRIKELLKRGADKPA